MSWKDDRNLGPWPFTKKESKPAYNEGDHLATYASPVWSMEEGSNVPITPTHNPCGYWNKGWYLLITKSGSGTGVVISDVAGIDCGSSCYSFFPDRSTVVLTATPDSGMTFEEWSGDGIGLVTRSVFMDGNKVVNAEFSSIPKNPYLIGWYKFDEGSGLVASNSALDGSSGGGLLPNLTVFNGYNGLFWTFNPGFGATPQLYFGAGTGADFAWSKPNRTIGGANKATMGMFIKRKSDIGNKGGYALGSRSAVVGGTLGIRLFTCNQSASQGYSWLWNVTPSFIYDVNLINQWLFHFFDGDGYYRIVKSDGTILQSAAAINFSARQYIYDFTGVDSMDADPPTKGYYPGGCSYGDKIIYNQITLTLNEWGAWYDKLRSRYEMAARSGW